MSAAAAGPQRRPAQRRSRALLPGLVGAGLGLVAGAQPWWRATGDGVAVAFSGTETTAGLAQALAVVALAGWLLVLVLATRGRQVVAALLALAGAGMAAVGLLGLRPSASTVRSQVREVSLATQVDLQPTGWSTGYASAGALVMAGAVLVLLTAPRWPQRVDRFTREPPAGRVTTATDDPAEVWRAQDAGLDPTTAPAATPDGAVGPDVRRRGFGDTMGAAEDRSSPSPPE